MELSTAEARLGLYIGIGVAIVLLVLIAITLLRMCSLNKQLAPPKVIMIPPPPTYPYTLVSTAAPPLEYPSFWDTDTSI